VSASAIPARLVVNAVSAKMGGARTIVESLVDFARTQDQLDFVILAGFQAPEVLPAHVEWVHRPMSGASAIAFNLLGCLLSYRRHRGTALLSFNNMNCVLLPKQAQITYFHQLKALDTHFKETKLRIMRAYMRLTRERVIVQSLQVEDDFLAMFGDRHAVTVIWPGVSVPPGATPEPRQRRTLLIPVASPQSPHKNFAFIRDTAQMLGPDWTVLVTAPVGAADPGPATNIRFIGPQTREDLFRQYRRASCVLMASTHETVGLPIFEALATDTPVVAYDAPYLRSLQQKFGIQTGLDLAATPDAAKDFILKAASSGSGTVAAQDFRRGEWDKLLEYI